MSHGGVFRALIIVVALLLNACGGGDGDGGSAAGQDASDNGDGGEMEQVVQGEVSQEFCLTYALALLSVTEDFDLSIEQLNEANNLVPSDAPESVKEYLQELVDIGNSSSDIVEFSNSRTPALTQNESPFEAYMEDNCGDDGSEAAAPVEVGPVVEVLFDRASNGKVGTVVTNVLADLMTVNATNASPASFMSGSLEEGDSNYVIVEVRFTYQDYVEGSDKIYDATDIKLTVGSLFDRLEPESVFVDGEVVDSILMQGEPVTVMAVFDSGDVLVEDDGTGKVVLDNEDFFVEGQPVFSELGF